MRPDSIDIFLESSPLLEVESFDELNAKIAAEYEGNSRNSSSNYLLCAISRFIRVWRHNKTEILHLAVTNVITTLVMEACVRTLLSGVFQSSPTFDFFVNDSHGLHINRQSLTNMWITALTSLFGGPVLFITTRSRRYVFFVCFGLVISIIGQMFAILTLGAVGLGFWGAVVTRLAFDFCYTGTVKFLFFEIARKPLLATPLRISLRIGGIRLSQDFSTTLIRVSLLNLFGLKG